MHTHQQAVRNVFSAGPLIQANSHDGVAISTGYDLRPGEIRVGAVRIANTGPRAERFRLVEADASSDFGAGELTLEIVQFGDGWSESLFEGEIGRVPAGGIDLGCLETGEERAYRFKIACSMDADGSGPDRVAGAAYEWDVAPGGVDVP